MSLFRSVLLILVFVAVTLVSFSCATANRAHTKFSPIIDIYIQGDRAIPDIDPIKVHARAGHGHDGKPIPSVIHWFGPPGEILKIEMKNPAQQCFREGDPKCESNHCQAFTNVGFTNPTPGSCDYRVWIPGKTQPYDPVVIVDNCCDN